MAHTYLCLILLIPTYAMGVLHQHICDLYVNKAVMTTHSCTDDSRGLQESRPAHKSYLILETRF